MIFEEKLAATANSIDGSMSGTELRENYARLRAEVERRRANSITRARAEVERSNLDSESAAYEAGWRAELNGDVSAAITSYQTAAQMDYSDAAFRLASLIDLVLRRFEESGDWPVTQYYDLVSEASKWYAEAHSAGYREADERLRGLLERALRIGERANSRNESAKDLAWTCRVMIAHAGEFLNGKMSSTEDEIVKRHLYECGTCRRHYLEEENSSAAAACDRKALRNKRFLKALLQAKGELSIVRQNNGKEGMGRTKKACLPAARALTLGQAPE